ncbi:MAG: class I SAM-dependent methyltransferase, partial [Steroidobacteraceae bacterium]|nr:class I SAM-dependent methyltransferase [Steroidobacteraceae bacterium]MDW8260479.1 methyltransferase domain-containing protein [Gammaproteobacteria bacterium]
MKADPVGTVPLVAWWESSQGRALIEAEAILAREALDSVFGWELLQVGAWGAHRELLAGARTHHAALAVSPEQRASGVVSDLVARPAQLPIASDCVDAVLLPHTLEFVPDPYAVVREIDRVLTGEGQLLVLGFRPWSAWGLRATAARGAFPPGLRRLLPERRLRDWLVLLGYEVGETRRYLFDLPWGQPSEPLRALRRGLTAPWPAGAYLLRARKRLYAGTPLRLRLR